MKRLISSHRQRYNKPRLPTRKNARLPSPVTSRTSTSNRRGTLLSILKLFALVCVLSFFLTMALFYIVTHGAEMTSSNVTLPQGNNPPLPVDVDDDKRSTGADKAESIILSKMMEGHQGHQEETSKRSPPGDHRQKRESKSPEAEKAESAGGGGGGKGKQPASSSKDDEKRKLEEAILRDLSPKDNQTPRPTARDTRQEPAGRHATPAGAKSSRTPTPLAKHSPSPQTPAPHTPAPQSPTPKSPTPKSPAPKSPGAHVTPTAQRQPQPKATPHPSQLPTLSPSPTYTPTPIPPRKEPPALPVVRHVSHEPKPPTWQERATLQDIENFIFGTTPVVNFSMGVTEKEIETFQVVLPSTIPNYHAPCWLEDVPEDFTYEKSLYRCHINFRRITKAFDFMESVLLHRQLLGRRWRIRCLPAFYLIGVLKSGTTDMYECLTKHPNIIQPEIKEPEFWSRQRFEISPWLFKKECIGDKKAVTFSDYLDVYDKPSEAIRLSMNKRLDGSLFSDVVFGDFSTHTFVEIVGWDKTLDAPMYVSAHHIHQIAPHSKFVLMLRDPVERAYSRYKMRFARRQNVQGTAAEFHLRMLREVKDTLECMKTNSRRFCVYKENFGREGYHTMLVHGLYVIYLNDWLSIVPRDQLYVVRFEDYTADRLEYVEDIAYFLGVGPFPENIRREIERMPVPNTGADIGPMMNETRTLLREFYKPFNHELADVLHDTRYRWGY